MSNNKKIINKEGENNMGKKVNNNFIKCPSCGTLIEVSKEDYAKILEQVRTKEFEKDVKNNLEQQKEKFEKDLMLEKDKLEKEFTEKLHQQETDSQKVLSEKEKEFTQKLNKKDAELTNIKNELANKDTETQLEIKNAVSKKESELAEAKVQISTLESDMKVRESEYATEKQNLINSHQMQLDAKATEIENIRHNFALLNNKMVGEVLEEYVSDTFNDNARMFPGATFVKDTKAIKNSKGDFIFRDSEDGIEFISIMFEVKNQMADSDPENQKKNSAHLKKLDQDRKNKNCEYAVLISNLEPENERYNRGLVEVSEYDKMYVIRPQLFIPLLNVLVYNTKGAVPLLKKIKELENQSLDIANFENEINEIKRIFAYHCKNAINNYKNSLEDIDTAIEKLKDAKDKLTRSEDQLGLANNKLEKINIRKLTKGIPALESQLEENEA